MQFDPMIRVDGRGVIGVSWYDTRNSDGSPVYEYDVYFACSTVSLRPAGDLDGDFDVDLYDNDLARCFGPTYPDCECALLDVDEDGDVDWEDFRAFPELMTGTLCDCHGPCHPDLRCGGDGGDGGGQEGGEDWLADALASLPSECELAAWYVAYVPEYQVQLFLGKLLQYLKEHPEDPAAGQISVFIGCVYASLQLE